MPTFEATVGPGGTVSLPEELCERLGIVEGAKVEFFLTVDGQVHFHAITGTTRGLGGLVAERRVPPVSVREMDDGIAEHVCEQEERLPTARV